jgi:hypothetical protein
MDSKVLEPIVNVILDRMGEVIDFKYGVPPLITWTCDTPKTTDPPRYIELRKEHRERWECGIELKSGNPHERLETAVDWLAESFGTYLFEERRRDPYLTVDITVTDALKITMTVYTLADTTAPTKSAAKRA